MSWNVNSIDNFPRVRLIEAHNSIFNYDLMLNRKNRLFKNYRRHGYKADDNCRTECQEAVEIAK